MERKPLSGQERDWFKDAHSLSERASGGQTLTLKRAVIAGRELKGAELRDVHLEDVTWDNMGADKTVWQNGVVEDSDVTYSDFREATFRNVTFRKVQFHHVNLTASTMENVHFVDCSFDDVILSYLKGSRVVFENAKFPERTLHSVKDRDFDGSAVQLVFRGTRLSWPNLGELKPGASLTFIDSTVENGDIGFGQIEKIEARDSHLELGADNARIGTVDIQGGYTSITMATSRIGPLVVKDSRIDQLNVLQNSILDSVMIRGCKGANVDRYQSISFGDYPLGSNKAEPSTAGQVTISNCKGLPADLEYLNAARITLRDSEFPELILKNATIKDLDLAHVTVEGKADISAAHVEAYRRHAVKRGSGASYVHEGANFELFGPDTDNALEESRATHSSPTRDQNAQAGSSWLQRWFGGQG